MKPHHDDNLKSRLLISTQPNLGLDGDARRAVVEILNHALANNAALTEKKAWMLRSYIKPDQPFEEIPSPKQ